MELHFLYLPKTVKGFIRWSFTLPHKEHLTWQAMELSAGLLKSLGILLSRKYKCTCLCWHRKHETSRRVEVSFLCLTPRKKLLGLFHGWFDYPFLLAAEEQEGSAQLKGSCKSIIFALWALGSDTDRSLGTKQPPTRPWHLYGLNAGSYYLVESLRCKTAGNRSSMLRSDVQLKDRCCVMLDSNQSFWGHFILA